MFLRALCIARTVGPSWVIVHDMLGCLLMCRVSRRSVSTIIHGARACSVQNCNSLFLCITQRYIFQLKMAANTPMYVIKRDGRHAQVSFDKITSRITKLCYGLDPKVSIGRILSLWWYYNFYSHSTHLAFLIVCRPSCHRAEGCPGCISRSNNGWTRRARCTDGCFVLNAPPRLLHPRCACCCVKPPQTNE